MKHSRQLLIVLLALVLGMGSAAAIGTGRSTPERVYTVAALRGHLDHQPAAWSGRTVLVRAIAGRCIGWVAVQGSTCVAWSSELIDAEASRVDDGLPLAVRATPPLQALLRRLPLVGRLAPAPPVVYWGVAAVYHVQLRPARAGRCASQPCYAALLLDAAL